MMHAALYPRFVTTLLLILLTINSNGTELPQTNNSQARFQIAYSEKLDAATFLNAISDNPRFNAPWKELREIWEKKISQDSVVTAAFKRWQGRGIQLAYLLSALPEDDLDKMLKRFDTPASTFTIIEEKLDEPAYQSVFDDFKRNYKDIKTLFTFMIKNGFRELREKQYHWTLETTKINLEDSLKKINSERYVNYLEAFIGKKVPDRTLHIYVLLFSKPLSFQLSGFAIGWASETENFAWLLTHEFMHKFNPTAKNLELQRHLAENDKFYSEAYERIYQEFDEGKEEEFVEAASRYIISTLGLTSEVRNLRSMKFLYYSNKTNRGDVPLAAILLDELSRKKTLSERFNYNTFITEVFESGKIQPGKVEELYRKAIKPVSGMAGMVIQTHENGAKVDRVFSNLPAEHAGIVVGDILLGINSILLKGKSREEILDLLAGEPGTPVEIVYSRSGETRRTKLALQ